MKAVIIVIATLVALSTAMPMTGQSLKIHTDLLDKLHSVTSSSPQLADMTHKEKAAFLAPHLPGGGSLTPSHEAERIMRHVNTYHQGHSAEELLAANAKPTISLMGKKPKPIPPLYRILDRYPNWSLWGDEDFQSTGWFDFLSQYIAADPTAMRYPLRFGLDLGNKRMDANHTTTKHYVHETESSLGLRGGTAPNFVWSFYNTAPFVFDSWPALYNPALGVTDDEEEDRYGNGKAVDFIFPRVQDHHVALNSTARVSATVRQFTRGRNAGKWEEFTFTFRFAGCNPVVFRWHNDEIQRGTPPASYFNPSPYMPLPVSAQPAYGNLPFAYNCVTVPPAV